MEIYDAWQLRGKRFTTSRFSRDITRELAELRHDNLTGALYIVKDYLVILACALMRRYGSRGGSTRLQYS
ncbi:hypothetical protein QFZ97_006409 [Paraburkholderia youngii]